MASRKAVLEKRFHTPAENQAGTHDQRLRRYQRIHGQAPKLKALLRRLGCAEKSGVWRHPERQVIFPGDCIDRDPAMDQLGASYDEWIAWMTELPPWKGGGVSGAMP